MRGVKEQNAFVGDSEKFRLDGCCLGDFLTMSSLGFILDELNQNARLVCKIRDSDGTEPVCAFRAC